MSASKRSLWHEPPTRVHTAETVVPKDFLGHAPRLAQRPDLAGDAWMAALISGANAAASRTEFSTAGSAQLS